MERFTRENGDAFRTPLSNTEAACVCVCVCTVLSLRAKLSQCLNKQGMAADTHTHSSTHQW